MIVEISFVPIGVGTSLSQYIAKVINHIDESGLKYQLTPMGTIIEADWEEYLVSLIIRITYYSKWE